MDHAEYRFWFSETRGLIRQRQTTEVLWPPEVWNGARWVNGSPYVMDAIIGMGEDPWSCGEWTDHWSTEQAMDYAKRHGIDLYGENPDAGSR